MSKLNLSQNILWPLVALFIAFGAFYLKPWQTKPQEIISVTAEGKIQAVPNVAQITGTIETKNANLDLARIQNEAKVTQIITELKKLGIEEKDIKTQNISAGPTYEDISRPEIQIFPPPPKQTTNQFSTSLQITLRNFDYSDETLEALTTNGATNIYGPNLTLDDQKLEEAKSQARAKAIDNARKKAEELAKLSNRKLGKAVSIKEQEGFQPPIPIYAQSEVDLKQKAGQIQPGQNEVIINLAVDFSLK